jgi:hypothetical protein
MKKAGTVIIVLAAALMLSGCATSYVATKMGVNIGKMFLKSRDLGVPELKKLVRAWPYVAGQIKAIPHYNEEVPAAAQTVVAALDGLAQKSDDVITDEDCGKISTDFVLIEYYAAQFGWDKYGVDIVSWAKTALGLG